MTALGFGESGWGPALLYGAVMTLLVSIAGLAIGAALGSLVAWAKLSGARVAGAIGEGYAALFRGLPELLVIYFVYFGSSALLTAAAHLLGIEGFVGVPSFAAGALAVGICGKDGGLVRAKKLERTKRDPDSHIERMLDLGFVGEPTTIDVRVIHALTGGGLVPVIAPVDELMPRPVGRLGEIE